MVEKRPYADDGSVQNGNKRPKSQTDALSRAKAIAQARAAEIAARHAKAKGQAVNTPTPPAQASPPPPPTAAGGDATATRLAEIRARVAALSTKAKPTDQPPARPGPLNGARVPPPEPEQDMSRPRGGLAIGLHPALMGDVEQDSRAKGKNMGSKFATTRGNRRNESPTRGNRLDLSGPSMEEIKANPYFDPKLPPSANKTQGRISRSLVFNPKGKYIEQGTKLRAQAQLEKVKQMIADQAKKAGADDNNEKGFLVQAPPDVEWWDEGLLEDKTYDCLDNPNKVKISGDDSLITLYVQHPVQLKPPQEQLLVQVKPMYLTPKEQAKLRRMRRAAELKETQAKIRLGLEPPPPPKIKRGNMMRVMGEKAIADPTAVEMLVEQQIQERALGHERANEERKLTKEQRHAKLAEQQNMDAQKGLHMCVFKIDSLAYGKHRYQIDINAKQHALTGITILHPKLNLVIVEGGTHSVNKYKKLMLHRIKWTENAMPVSVREGNQEAEAQWLQSVDDKGQLKDLSFNKCTLIFEGEIKQRGFRSWKSRVCEHDGDAKEALARAKMDSLWALAKSVE